LLMHSARIGTRPMRQLGATIPVPESAITGYWPGTYLANLHPFVRVADLYGQSLPVMRRC
jgi:hypothetical protein